MFRLYFDRGDGLEPRTTEGLRPRWPVRGLPVIGAELSVSPPDESPRRLGLPGDRSLDDALRASALPSGLLVRLHAAVDGWSEE